MIIIIKTILKIWELINNYTSQDITNNEAMY